MEEIVFAEKGISYESPHVEVIEVEVEQGFASSDMERYSPADGNGGWS